MMILRKHKNMNDDDWWLHIYVMLSRVRMADQILIFGKLPTQRFFEEGPPGCIVDGISRLKEKARRCRPEVYEIRQGL
eukprot:6991448-Karenia_brevis.AAC.1